jgi:hypothetical protein
VARISGKDGRIYLEIASGGSASPLPFVTDWSINAATDKLEVTAMGDANKVYVSGLPDASGDLSFEYDDATAQTYTAAVDGIARKFYLYPKITGSPGQGQYWFGTVLIDFNLASSVSGTPKGTASWSAASTIAKVG